MLKIKVEFKKIIGKRQGIWEFRINKNGFLSLPDLFRQTIFLINSFWNYSFSIQNSSFFISVLVSCLTSPIYYPPLTNFTCPKWCLECHAYKAMVVASDIVFWLAGWKKVFCKSLGDKDLIKTTHRWCNPSKIFKLGPIGMSLASANSAHRSSW